MGNSGEPCWPFWTEPMLCSWLWHTEGLQLLHLCLSSMGRGERPSQSPHPRLQGFAPQTHVAYAITMVQHEEGRSGKR